MERITIQLENLPFRKYKEETKYGCVLNSKENYKDVGFWFAGTVFEIGTGVWVNNIRLGIWNA